MNKLAFIILFILISFSQAAMSSNDGILPMPVEYTAMGEGYYRLTKDVSVTFSDTSLAPTADWLCKGINELTGIKLNARQSDKTKNCINLSMDASNPLLFQNHKTYGVSPKSEVIPDERYALKIDKNGIKVIGASEEAVFRGCTTLLQLCNHKSQHSTLNTQLIKDAPTFAWRGLSLDISRCFIPAEDIKTVIDIMALYKLNVLHLHLNDNQGWCLEIKGFPDLTEKGGFVENDGKQGGYLTQEQYKDIVDYAAERQITVVPELDLPGHSNAIFKAYPQAKNIAKLPFEFNLPGQALACLDPDDEFTMKMVDEAIIQIASLTPSRYFHIGADETFGMQDDKYIKFVHHVRSLVHSLGKEVVGWQEMARAEVAEGDIIQNWIAFSKKQISAQMKRSSANKDPHDSANTKSANGIPQEVRDYLGKTYKKAPYDIPIAVSQGAKVLLSPQAFCYLDCPYEEESVDTAQKAERDRLVLQQYTRQNIKDMYEWNPTTYNKSLNYTKDIVGLEAAIWGESISSFGDMQFLLLPRLTEIAEKAWGATNSTAWDTYCQHLATQSTIWQKLGWNFFKSSLIDWK